MNTLARLISADGGPQAAASSASPKRRGRKPASSKVNVLNIEDGGSTTDDTTTTAPKRRVARGTKRALLKGDAESIESVNPVKPVKPVKPVDAAECCGVQGAIEDDATAVKLNDAREVKDVEVEIHEVQNDREDHEVQKDHERISNSGATTASIKVYSAFAEHMDRAAPLSISDDENVILQLKVSTSVVNDDDAMNTGIDSAVHNDHGVVKPYSKTVSDTFASKPFALVGATASAAALTSHRYDELNGNTLSDNIATQPAIDTLDGVDCGGVNHAKDSPVGGRIVRLLMDFEEKSKIGEWPSNTSVCCHWCCHKFNTVPIGLPVKYVHERFQVTGCFCSMECAAAWNFASRESPDEVHERYALINLLSSCAGYGKVVRPAPDRCALAMFGGHMSIDEFRRFSSSNKAMMCSCNPMMSLTQQVEEISESELRSEYKFIPLDKDRVNKYQEKIRLRRTKPLINYKNTLDCTMNLRYH